MQQRLMGGTGPFPSAPGLTIKSLVCQPAGPGIQNCTWIMSDGQTETLTVPSGDTASLPSP
jgi:hypothetical protein